MVSANGSTNLTLPITFPNQCVFASFNGGNPTTDAQDNNPFVSNKSAAAITVFNAENGPIAGQYLAIGF